jgi:hypothetical protein
LNLCGKRCHGQVTRRAKRLHPQFSGASLLCSTYEFRGLLKSFVLRAM